SAVHAQDTAAATPAPAPITPPTTPAVAPAPIEPPIQPAGAAQQVVPPVDPNAPPVPGAPGAPTQLAPNTARLNDFQGDPIDLVLRTLARQAGLSVVVSDKVAQSGGTVN